MSDYMPTDEEVREDFAYPWEGFKQDREGRLAAFDRWLAEHDAKVRAEALREARDNVRATHFWADGSDNYAGRVRGYLNFEADHIEREAGLK